jgi:hypothetical protein
MPRMYYSYLLAAGSIHFTIISYTICVATCAIGGIGHWSTIRTVGSLLSSSVLGVVFSELGCANVNTSPIRFGEVSGIIERATGGKEAASDMVNEG